MKHAYKTRYFDKPVPDSLLPGHEWIPNYYKNCRKLIEYTKNQNCKKTQYRITIYCLADLYAYLVGNCTPYSYEAAEEWRRQNPKDGYKVILQRLNDLYTYGKIKPEHSLQPKLVIRKNLKEPWAGLVDDYLTHADIRNSCITYVITTISRFLLKMQEKGLNDPSEITFDLLEEFLTEEKANRKTTLKGMGKGDLNGFLSYLEQKKRCRNGLSLYLRLRNQFHPIQMSDLGEEQISRIEGLRAESLSFPAEEFGEALPGFADCLEKHHYATKEPVRRRLMRFLLFLTMNCLGYHAMIARIWVEQEKAEGVPGWRHDFRILHLFETYVENGDILPKKNISLVVSTYFDRLPEWCKSGIEQFMKSQRRKGYRHSTIRMFYVSLSRFSWFLVGKKVTSFSEITPILLEEFSLTDSHITGEGKNAYNSRIRRFLRFLEDEGVIPYGTNSALMCTSASREGIINILTEEEQTKALEPADTTSPLDLRDRAMVAIGLLMGIRASDVLWIRLEDIDWNKQTIRIVQRKTGKEIIQPMPVKVGNAIYLYLKYGRNNALAESATLFIKDKPPYDSLTVNACRRAVEHIIPARKEGRRVTFHDLRRTFATNLLRNGCGAWEISELLGHSEIESVSRYVNLDDDKMRLCPISLKEAGLEMGWDI